MSTKTMLRIVLVAVLVLGVCVTESTSGKKGGKPGGGGGGGSVPNPAWTVIKNNSVKLLSFDGTKNQTVAGGGRVDRFAATFSPDGAWIAYIQQDRKGDSIYRVRADGSQIEQLGSFPWNGANNYPLWWGQLAWVPGEVDRIIYSGGNVEEFYVISTVAGGPPVLLGLYGVGATLSPDREPDVPGYQGAIAYSGGLLNVLLVEDGPTGLEVDLESRQTFVSLGRTQTLPAWSHDGLEVAFLYGDESLGDGGNDSGTMLMVLPVLADTTGITLLEDDLRIIDFNPERMFHRPTWSPDDGTIGFVSRVNGSYDLWVADSSGQSDSVRITNNGNVGYPDWNPVWDATHP